MQINNALRKRLTKFLPNNYRAVIVKRLKAKGKSCHPNTVRNVLNGSFNSDVALELLNLAKEESDSQKKANRIAKSMLSKVS